MVRPLLPVLAAALVLVAQFTQRALIRPGLIMMQTMCEDKEELEQP